MSASIPAKFELSPYTVIHVLTFIGQTDRRTNRQSDGQTDAVQCVKRSPRI